MTAGGPKAVVLSPTFYSHFNPLLVLASALQRAGAEVVVGCGQAFAAQVEAADMRFIPLDISRNANVGIAQQTEQARAEAARLEAFFHATREGPIATLMLQSRHRQDDMLSDPHRLRREIAALDADERPDFYIIDQLSYAVTLALTCLQLPFVTFCPGHPTYIPTGGELFGVPYRWPQEIIPTKEALAVLRAVATETDQRFTRIFNNIIATHAPDVAPVDSAFRVASSQARVFMYPEFDHLQRASDDVENIFMGYSFTPEPLPSKWQVRLAGTLPGAPTVLITLGTFLSARDDVLVHCIEGVIDYDPQAKVIVSAGANADRLSRWRSESVVVASFVPQKALLAHVDMVIHHGGNNSFTETLFHGKPMLILPFSSDQFAIAHDAQSYGLAEVLDPNVFDHAALGDRLHRLLVPERSASLARWQKHVRSRGPDYAAGRLLAVAIGH